MRQHDEQRGEDGPLQRVHGRAKNKIGGQEQEPGEQFDGRIHRGNFCFAVAAFAAEENPAQDGNIVVRRDGLAAFRAARCGQHDGLVRGNPQDADIQKASDEQAK